MTPAARLRTTILGCVLLALGSALAPAVADDQIATRFEMFGFAGIQVLTLHTRTEESGKRYAVSVDYKTEGMASLFVDLTTDAQVQGRIIAGSARPERFRDDTRRNGAQRHSRVDYRPDGTVIGSSTAPLPKPVTPQAAQGTIDNLTAYYRLERQLARTGSCGLSERVYDGRHGYDLIFTDAGQQALTPLGGQNFAGEAIACRMTRRDWVGFPNPEKGDETRRGMIWYARLIPGDDVLVPVRMRMDTPLGIVDGFLAELHSRAVNLRLMP